ncbi:hypothetical protein [Melissospora conviva]|uniref:hypothetical protein n=1 Tax=Melissospora conviva TaxID=3388432 RepID=UPI003C28AB14
MSEFLGRLAARQLEAWAPTALRRSRRATFVQTYDGPDGGVADMALRGLTAVAHTVRGGQFSVVVVAPAGDPGLAARLGAVEAELPREVAVHALPGDAGLLPVALKAAGAAGAPTFAFVVAAQEPPRAVLAAAAAGRPADLLLCSAAGEPGLRGALESAGFTLVNVVEVLIGGHPYGLAFGTGSERSLTAFKEALWSVPHPEGLRYREPAERGGGLIDAPEGAPEVLRQEVLTQLGAAGGALTVNDLRRHVLTHGGYRPADLLAVVADLHDAGVVTHDRDDGRIGGDTTIRIA